MNKTVINEAEKKVLTMGVQAAMKQLAEVNAYVSRLRSLEDVAGSGQIDLTEVSSMVSPEVKKSLLLGAAAKLPHLLYVRSHEEEITETKEQTQESREKVLGYLAECRASIHEKEQARIAKVKEYKAAAREKAATISDELPELLEDLLKGDVNKRIQEYNEICLKLYRTQQQLERKLAALEEVNMELISLYEESDTEIMGLQQKMDQLVGILAIMDAPESILDSCAGADMEEDAEEAAEKAGEEAE